MSEAPSVTAPSGADSTSASTMLDERYGTKRQRGIDRRVGWIVGSLAVIVIAALALPTLWLTESVASHEIHYEVIDDVSVRLDFEVTAAPNTPVACAIEALSPSYGTVGWKIVEFPASGERTRRTQETLVTTQPATTAALHSCWAIETPR